jgi:hypothetical protein
MPTMWKAPFTGRYEKIIPPGLKFVVAFDPPASAAAADPEPFSEWEVLLVEAGDYANPKSTAVISSETVNLQCPVCPSLIGAH